MNKRWLTVAEVCDLIDISYDTWAKWRAKGKAPKAVKLPNGALRIEAVELELWLGSLEAA